MALLMFDGFEMFPSSVGVTPATDGPWATAGSTNTTYSTTRTGTRAAINSSSGVWKTKSLGAAVTVIIGFGFHATGNYSFEVLTLNGNVSGSVADLYYDNGTDELVVRTGANTELHRESYASALYKYVELKVTTNGATSSIELKINNVSVYNNASVDLEVGSNTGVESCTFINALANDNFTRGSVDDVYICDDTGASQNDFLGPVRIHALNPSADASVTWTPDSGVDNYARVDEGLQASDDDTSYVSSSTVGAKDLYEIDDLAAELTSPVAVQVYYRARHDNSSGAASVASMLKSGTTEVEGTEFALTSAYVTKAETTMHLTDPDTGVAWTAAGVNALQIGAIVKSS